jgi:hypothetical protein
MTKPILSFLSRFALGAAVLAALGGLAACGKQDSAPAAGAASAPASLDGLRDQKAMTQAAERQLPKGDPATPLGGYRKIDSGNQVMFAYFGLLNLPVPYEDIAKQYSEEYRRTSDSFQQKDIVKALQPRIDQEIAQAKAARYVLLEQRDGALLERYNFDKKSFAVKGMDSNDRYTYFNDNSNYTLGTTNATQFAALNVTDEAKARAIEGYLSKYTPLRLEVYAYAQDADPSTRRVKLQVMKLRLYGPGNELLAEQ